MRPPVKVSQQFYTLTKLGVPADAYRVQNIGFESDRGLGISWGDAPNRTYAFVDFKNAFAESKKQNPSESGLPHPTKNIVAFRAKLENDTVVQIFNLESNPPQKLKNVRIPGTYALWSWVNDTTVGLVTNDAVYHLDTTQPPEAFKKIIDRKGNIETCQIISYKVDPQGIFASISGISSADGGQTIDGALQFCQIEKGQQQSLAAHIGCFGKVKIHSELHESILFAYAERTNGQNKITISEIGPLPTGVTTKHKISFDLVYPGPVGNDFPIFMSFANKFGLLYVLTRSGTIFIYDAATGARILGSRLSDALVITAAPNVTTDGIFVLNRNGNVIQLDIEPSVLVDFIKQNGATIPNAVEVATNLAIRNGLPGAEQYYIQKFNTLMMNSQYKEAAEVVAASSGTMLRNKETIEKFRGLPKLPNQPYPLIQYFYVLLERGKLNDQESIELSGLVLTQGKKALVEDWISKDKLTYTEALGDIVMQYDPDMAGKIYKRAGSPKAMNAILASGGSIDDYLRESGMAANVDFLQVIKTQLDTNPAMAIQTAKALSSSGKINSHKVCDLLIQASRPNEFVQFCVDALKANRPEDAQYQTTALEITLKSNPSYAENIFLSGQWTQYNKQRIAPLCEAKGLLNRALENFTDIKDIKRVILNTGMFQFDFLVGYLSKLPAEDALVCLAELLRHNRANIKLVVQVAQNSYEKLGVAPVVKMLEQISAFDGVYFFLQVILPHSQDKDIYFKYIEAAVKCNQLKEVEKVIVEATHCYDPIRVKEFLLEMKLTDPKPLIMLCDKNGFVGELTKYLWMNNFRSYIEAYIWKVNNNAAPEVVGNLIDLEAEELYLKGLVIQLRGNCPIPELIQAFEKRNKLRYLELWLEQRVAEGNTSADVHNALAKIVIDTDKHPSKFLHENRFYDPKAIGKYCEERDPHLAFEAYKRDFGKCDYELVDLSNKNALYRLQAKYLVERRDTDLWAHVLSPDNPHRQLVVEQIVSSAIPDSHSVEEVTEAVRAFSKAELNVELLSLLEKILLHNSEFSNNRPLQHLLIVTAMKSDKGRVMDYINRLDNYDGKLIADAAKGENFGLYEEAFTIYNKIGEFVEAMKVILGHISNIQRASEYAERVNKPEVWGLLGQAYLSQGLVSEAIESFIKAQDSSFFLEVIQAAQAEEKWEILHGYLDMARKTRKDATIDSELLFGLAKLGKLTDIETFIGQPSSADYQRIGEKCFQHRLYEAAKILFNKIKSNSRIASCLVHLKQYPQALEAAKKANNTKTWKEVALACISAGEFKLAAVAGQNIIIHADHVEDLSKQYELYDKPEEMISLLESSLTLERAHIGMFTELGILYAKYNPGKLMDYIRSYFQKLNVSKLLRVCERYLLWNEAVYLNANYDEHDNAIKIMIEHSPTAFKHDTFVNIIQKVMNNELLYRAIDFYMEEEPERINELLRHVTAKVDLSKVVNQIRRAGYLPIIVDWLKSVQNKNNQAVNDALNQLYLEIGDFQALRESIANYESIDAIGLAKQIEGHDSPEFRRISALIYRRNKKYQESINASKSDKQYRDAIETAQESGNPKLAEDLLRFFAENGEKEYFTVCTFTCNEMVAPDLVLELAWRYGLNDFAFPFFIQMVRDLTHKVEKVQKKHEEREKKEEERAEQVSRSMVDPYPSMMMTPEVSPFPMLMGSGMTTGSTFDSMGGMGAGLGAQGGFGAMGGMGAGFGGRPF